MGKWNVSRVAFLLLMLGQRGLSFPVNICPRIVRVYNVLSVLVFTNIQEISVVHSFIACVAIFPNEFYIRWGEKALSKSWLTILGNTGCYLFFRHTIKTCQEILSKDCRRVIIIGTLRKDVFERRPSTGSEAFSLFICLDANKLVLLSFFSLLKTIYPRVSTKPLPNDAKSPLPVDVRRSKTLLLKLPNVFSVPTCRGGRCFT